MSKRIQIADTTDDDEQDQDLKNLLQKYIQRSEELEKRESQVMEQIEMMQSAVSSLQSWNRSRKSTVVSSDPDRLNLSEIEEETRQIQEETRKIQQEVEEKMEENKKLQEEVERRKRSLSDAVDAGKKSRVDAPEGGRKGARNRGATPPEADLDAGIGFFQQKLQKLKEVERKVKRESELQTERNRQTRKEMQDKLEVLEWESQLDKQILDSLQKNKNNK